MSWKRLIATTAFGCLACLGCAPAVTGPNAGGGDKVGQGVYNALKGNPKVHVIVALREPDAPATTQSARQREIETDQLGVLDVLSADEFAPTHRWQNINAMAGWATASGIEKLGQHPSVARVDVEGVRHARAAESVPLIHGDEAHNLGFTGKGIVVAVLDTGVDSDHRDLFDAIVDQQCFCSGSCRCPNGSQRQSGPGAAEDDEGHGTNVTGIINSAGRVAPVGVAPDSAIVALKVLGADGGGGDAGILSALDYVIARREIRVVNMSLGGGRFSTVCDNADASNRAFGSAIATLRAQGTITLVAAGNDAFTDAVSSPACVNAAVAVGAVYDQNIGGIRASKCVDPTTAPDQVACFSNSSTLVELLGPGAMITSSGLGGGTLTEGGTSQATPHVAGAAALLFQANPGLTPSEVVSALSRTGVPIRDAKSGVTIPRIDVKAALDAVR